MRDFIISPRRHEQIVRMVPCMVSDRTPVTIHHCHGGSMKDGHWHVGMGQKQNPFLIIPLHADYHVGDHGIDYGIGVKDWEYQYGTQAEHLLRLDSVLQNTFDYSMSIIELAYSWQDIHAKG